MAPIYKIHPGIGFARVGKSQNDFFLAPESMGGTPVDLDKNGNDVPFRGYKDSEFILRRQAARFRIHEYERDTNGRLVFVREITANEAKITWHVELCSRKAAGPKMSTSGRDEQGAQVVVPGSGFRNAPPDGGTPPFTRDDIQARVSLSATGKNSRPKPGSEPMAKLLRKDLYIGEVRTDAAGRLVVLGGKGVADSWSTPSASLVNFLNNPTWYDDIADGPVDAEIKFKGQSPIKVRFGAWVITCPPDFAPRIEPMTTLLDVVEDALNVPLPVPLTFPQDIAPLLRRAANNYWVNELTVWSKIRGHLATMSDLADPSSEKEPLRRQVRDDLLKAESQITDYRLTRRQKAILSEWVDGDFNTAEDNNRPQPSPGRLLDRVSLSHCVGGGFFPGIEAGVLLRSPEIYAEFGRFTRDEFEDIYPGENDEFLTLTPGAITERMACPWQADFIQCHTSWWPAQRPDIARFRADGSAEKSYWADPLGVGEERSHEAMKNMVDEFARLGVIEPLTIDGESVFAEIGKDPSLDGMV